MKIHNIQYTAKGCDFVIDIKRISQDPRLAKYLTGYKQSVKQLAVQRRISNQK